MVSNETHQFCNFPFWLHSTSWIEEQVNGAVGTWFLMVPRTTVYEHTLILLVSPLINKGRLFSGFAMTIKVIVNILTQSWWTFESTALGSVPHQGNAGVQQLFCTINIHQSESGTSAASYKGGFSWIPDNQCHTLSSWHAFAHQGWPNRALTFIQSTSVLVLTPDSWKHPLLLLFSH